MFSGNDRKRKTNQSFAFDDDAYNYFNIYDSGIEKNIYDSDLIE